MKKLLIALALTFLTTSSFAQTKDDDLAYQTFEQGRDAFALGHYNEAVSHF